MPPPPSPQSVCSYPQDRESFVRPPTAVRLFAGKSPHRELHSGFRLASAGRHGLSGGRIPFISASRAKFEPPQPWECRKAHPGTTFVPGLGDRFEEKTAPSARNHRPAGCFLLRHVTQQMRTPGTECRGPSPVRFRANPPGSSVASVLIKDFRPVSGMQRRGGEEPSSELSDSESISPSCP